MLRLAQGGPLASQTLIDFKRNPIPSAELPRSER